MTKKGLSSNEFKEFEQLLIKANESQLGLMGRSVYDERKRRGMN